MADASALSVRLRGCLERLRAGDDRARQELIDHACERLRRLTRAMLRRDPKVHRWEETDDVLQEALLKLYRALEDVKPDSVREFFDLAATQIRRQLIDLYRHYYGPEGLGANHASDPSISGQGNCCHDRPDSADGPSTCVEREEARQRVHQLVETLPQQEQEVVNLLVYQGLTQAEAAAILDVTVRTVKRYWRSAKLTLHDALQAEL